METTITVKELRALKDKDQYEVFDPRLNAWVSVRDSTLLDTSPAGYAPVDDPFNMITAITVYLDWLDQCITLAMPPKTLTFDQANEIAGHFENTIVFKTEAEMLDTFLNLIDDADVLSGWNSEGYDIPYTVGRISRILSKTDLRRLCLWGQMPKMREYTKFGATNITYDLVGRVHLDYLLIYRKFTYEERHSYALNAIGEHELGEKKVEYEGSLDQLYNQDFHKFIEYNRQDVMLLAKLDKKLKFLDLCNELAHDIPVLLQSTLGTVALTDQALINEAHKHGFIAPSRKSKIVEEEIRDDDDEDEERDDFDDGKAAGAYVVHPKTGMHKYIGAIDINSLYPSTLRALNMGPETIVAQLRPIMTENLIKERMRSNGGKFALAWEGLFGTLEYQAVMAMDKNVEITIDWEQDGSSTVHTAQEVWEMIFNGDQPWAISANGTIFTYAFEGIIPQILRQWYSTRKELQKKKAEATDPKEIAYWDKKQHVKKIQLNSLYGALLNAGSRFNDHRIGQSTTLTGRIISHHMDSFVNEAITGKYDVVGDAIIYGDSVTGDTLIKTDSGEVTIEDLFNSCPNKTEHPNGKEYGFGIDTKTVGFNIMEDAAVMSDISFVVRHKTKKKLYKITMHDGKSVTVTADHSLIVDRDGFTLEVKPTDLQDGDLIITLSA